MSYLSIILSLFIIEFYISLVEGVVNEERYFEQDLDHFDPLNNEVWQQRYFIRDDYYTKNNENSPIFICVGGEGPSLDSSVVYETENNVHCSLMVNFAKEVGALIVALEHRYYGESNPTENLEIQNLKYLSSEQAVMDIANFHSFISQEYSLDSINNRWITWGGSYPGMMASFARLKFPHLVISFIFFLNSFSFMDL